MCRRSHSALLLLIWMLSVPVGCSDPVTGKRANSVPTEVDSPDAPAEEADNIRPALDIPVPPGLERIGREVVSLLEECTAQVRGNPLDAEAWLELAMAYQAHELFPEAIRCYQQLAGLAPQRPAFVHYNRATCLARMGQIEAAVEASKLAQSFDSNYPPIYWRRGIWLMDLSRLDAAESAFRRATEVAPDDHAGWIGLARIALEHEDYAQARDLLEKLRQQNPTMGYVHLLLGMAYRGLGQMELSKTSTELGAGQLPIWFDEWQVEVDRKGTRLLLRLDRAREAVRDGRAEEVIPELEKLFETYPTEIPLLSTLTPAYVATGQIERAIEIQEIALAQRANHFRIHFNLGLLLARKNQLEKALFHTERAVELNPALSSIHSHKQQLLLQMGRKHDAIDVYFEADRVEALDAGLCYSSGRLLAQEARWEEASKCFERAARLAPGQATPLLWLAISRAELGQYLAACEARDLAAKLEPKHELLGPLAQKLELLADDQGLLESNR